MPRQVKRGGRKLTRRAYKQGGVFSNFGYGGYGNTGFFGPSTYSRGWGAAPAYNSWGGYGYGGGFLRRLFYGY